MYHCWVNTTQSGSNNTYRLDGKQRKEVKSLFPNTMYAIGCVKVADNGQYQCTEYNDTVLTGEIRCNLVIIVHDNVCYMCIHLFVSHVCMQVSVCTRACVCACLSACACVCVHAYKHAVHYHPSLKVANSKIPRIHITFRTGRSVQSYSSQS